MIMNLLNKNKNLKNDSNRFLVNKMKQNSNDEIDNKFPDTNK